jgi:hypothetical protein
MTPALPELQIGHMAKATEVEQYPIGGDRIPMLIHDDFGLVNIPKHSQNPLSQVPRPQFQEPLEPRFQRGTRGTIDQNHNNII